MSRASLALLAILAIVLVASPAAAHAAELTFTILEGDPCPDDRVSCIRVTGGPRTEGNIRDDTAEVRFQGAHPVSITVENGGEVEHNLTFEPGTKLGDYSIEDPIAPGESRSFNLTTIEDVPEGTYAFYCGQANHAELGERGTFVVQVAADEGGEEQTGMAQHVVGVPGPGALAALLAGTLAASARRRRRA